MIGIYSWTNKITGQQYVGQSIDIERRRKQHIYCATHTQVDTPLYASMRKYGLENFVFSVLEECSETDLDNQEKFWIKQLNTYLRGFNCNEGGQDKYCSIGEFNPNTKLTNQDVYTIRQRIHIGQEDTKKVYEDYKDLVSYDSFWQALHGHTWKNVDCSMIKPVPVNNQGSKNPRAKLTEEDIITIRKRKYIEQESTKDIYQDYKERISYSAFEKAILCLTWKHLPSFK